MQEWRSIMEQMNQTYAEQNEKEQKKRTLYLKIIMIASVISAIVLTASFVLVVPKWVTAMNSIQTTTDEIRAMSEQVTEMTTKASDMLDEMSGITEDLQELTSAGTDTLGSIDVETLNDSIQDLSKVVKPLANLFGGLSE